MISLIVGTSTVYPCAGPTPELRLSPPRRGYDEVQNSQKETPNLPPNTINDFEFISVCILQSASSEYSAVVRHYYEC